MNKKKPQEGIEKELQNYLKFCIISETLDYITKSIKEDILTTIDVGDSVIVTTTFDKDFLRKVIKEISALENTCHVRTLKVMKNRPRLVFPRAVCKKLGVKVFLEVCSVKIKELCNHVGQDWIDKNSQLDESQKPFLRWFK